MGVFFLVLSKVLEIVSFVEMVGQLGMYFLTVMIGLGVHGLVTIPLIFFICVRRFPYRDIAKMGQVLATAFGTGSRLTFFNLHIYGNKTKHFQCTAQPQCQLQFKIWTVWEWILVSHGL